MDKELAQKIKDSREESGFSISGFSRREFAIMAIICQEVLIDDDLLESVNPLRATNWGRCGSLHPYSLTIKWNKRRKESPKALFFDFNPLTNPFRVPYGTYRLFFRMTSLKIIWTCSQVTKSITTHWKRQAVSRRRRTVELITQIPHPNKLIIPSFRGFVKY